MAKEVPYILAISLGVLFFLWSLRGRMRSAIGPHELLAALLLPVIGYYGGIYALFALSVVGLIIVAPAVTPQGLLLPGANALDLRAKLFMFCLPLMPMLKYTLAISGLTFFQFTFVNLLSIGFIIAMLRSGVSMRSRALVSWDLAFAGMLAMQIFMDARGNHLTFALRACVIVLFNLGIPYLAISRACYRSHSPGALMLACIASCCILAIIAGFESQKHWLVYENLTARIHADPDVVTGYAKQRGGLLRARVTWSESTGLSLFLGLQFVMLVALRRRIGSNLAFVCTGAILLIGVFFTFARVGYVVLGVGLIACFIYERRWGHLIGLLFLMPMIATMIVLLAHVIPAVAASIGMADDADTTVDYRSRLLAAGLDLFKANWLEGMSMDEINDRLDFMRQGEGIIDLVNQPLIIFMRAGLLGGLVYYAILAGVVRGLFANAKRLSPDLRAAGGACFAGLLGLTVSLVTTSYGRNEMTYVVLLAFGVGLLGRQKESRPTTGDIRRAASAFTPRLAGPSDAKPGRTYPNNGWNIPRTTSEV